jgi:hypothetical protein
MQSDLKLAPLWVHSGAPFSQRVATVIPGRSFLRRGGIIRASARDMKNRECRWGVFLGLLVMTFLSPATGSFKLDKDR